MLGSEQPNTEENIQICARSIQSCCEVTICDYQGLFRYCDNILGASLAWGANTVGIICLVLIPRKINNSCMAAEAQILVVILEVTTNLQYNWLLLSLAVVSVCDCGATSTNRHFTPAYSSGNNQAIVYTVNRTRTVYLYLLKGGNCGQFALSSCANLKTEFAHTCLLTYFLL